MAHQWPGFMVRLPRFRRAHARLMGLYAEVRAAHDPALRRDVEPDFIDDMLELNRTHPHLMPETETPGQGCLHPRCTAAPLDAIVSMGAKDFTLEDCRNSYRRSMFTVFMLCLLGCQGNRI